MPGRRTSVAVPPALCRPRCAAGAASSGPKLSDELLQVGGHAVMRASSAAACAVLPAAAVSGAVRATPVMVEAMSVDPKAASVALRLNSFVAAVCSSTADAIVDCVSLTCSMFCAISAIAATATAARKWF